MQLEDAVKWREDAVADGWSIKPTYDEHESQDTHATLEREGYKAFVNARPGQNRNRIHIWCPKGISILGCSGDYNFDRIVAAVRTCQFCGSEDVDTVRIRFAERSCMDCVDQKRKELETPGWCS